MTTAPYDRLRTLTRDYARLTREGAGLGKVLGGFFLWVVAAVVAGLREHLAYRRLERDLAGGL